jgi:hypothetical protein
VKAFLHDVPTASADRATMLSRAKGVAGFAAILILAIAIFPPPYLAQVLTWTQKFPTTAPSPRFGNEMAYDAVRNEVVLFGGGSHIGIFGDTWTWDGTNWAQKFPAMRPSARIDHALAFDVVRGQTVLFGGFCVDRGICNDTWVWDGTNWTQRFPSTSPSARSVHAMAYDAAQGQVVLFGGRNFLGVALNDTWIWDGTTWTQKFPSVSPPSRGNHAMAYDTVRNEVVLFGGAGGVDIFRDTWTWDGATWRQRFPATSPSARVRHAMAFDAARGQTVLFGGQEASRATFAAGDTWTWDGTTWTQQISATSPSARTQHRMAYDSLRGQVVLFGGATCVIACELNETWVWPTVAPVDTSPPNIVASVSPNQNAAGWNNTDVTVTWSVTDAESGIVSSTGCERVTVTTEIAGVIFSCAATNGAGLSATETVMIKVDKTSPTIIGARAPLANAAGWNNTDVVVTFTCSDGLSGIQSCGPTTQAVSTEGAGQSRTATAVDQAGNITSATVGDISIDKTQPVVLVHRTPDANAHGWNNTDLTVQFEASDNLSGVVGTPFFEILFKEEGANQSAAHIFSDRAGNSAIATVGGINIDRTPPEAYNEFDPVARQVLVFGRDGLSGVPPGPVSPTLAAPPSSADGTSEVPRQEAQARTYDVVDRAGNTLRLVEAVNSEDGQQELRVLTLRYGAGTALTVPRNTQRFEWSFAEDESLTELKQRLEVRDASGRQEVEAQFESERNQTSIRVNEPSPGSRVVQPGLVLLRMATKKGKLVIEF